MAHPRAAVAGSLLALVLGSLAGCAQQPSAPQDPVPDALFAVQLVREPDGAGTPSGRLVLVDEEGASSVLAPGDGPAGAPLSTLGGLTVALTGHDAVLVDGAWVPGPDRTRVEFEVWATSVDGRAVRVLGSSSEPGAAELPMTLSVWDGNPDRAPREVELPEWARTGGVCGETVHLVVEPTRGPRHLVSVDPAGDGALRVRDVGPLRGDVLGMTGLHGLGCVDGDPVVVTRGPAERGGTERTHVVRIDARTAELSPLPASRDLADLEETWSLVGQVGDTGVLTTGHDRDVLTVDLRSGEVGTLLRDPPGEHQWVTVRGDRVLVLGQLEDGGFRAVVLDVATGKRLHEVDLGPVDFQDPGDGGTDVAGVALLEEG